MLGRARQGLARMTTIIREMADQGRLAAHNSMRARLASLIQEALSVLQPKIQSQELDIHCDLGEVGDRRVDGNLFHVFCNVIVNAMDEMGPGGLLEISAWQSGETIFIDFADTGAGLLAEIPEQIFEPFYTTKPPGSGSGLGLAICRELIDRMGGQIHASNRPTGGARITLSLPAADSREQADA
jgi:signal transduction histidine kinase